MLADTTLALPLPGGLVFRRSMQRDGTLSLSVEAADGYLVYSETLAARTGPSDFGEPDAPEQGV